MQAKWQHWYSSEYRQTSFAPNVIIKINLKFHKNVCFYSKEINNIFHWLRSLRKSYVRIVNLIHQSMHPFSNAVHMKPWP
jgi:hypothetical protein